jgi:hypothetical protein
VVRAIVYESHREAERLLSTNRDKLDALARAMLKAESLDAKVVLEATGLPEPADADEDEVTKGTPFEGLASPNGS